LPTSSPTHASIRPTSVSSIRPPRRSQCQLPPGARGRPAAATLRTSPHREQVPISGPGAPDDTGGNTPRSSATGGKQPYRHRQAPKLGHHPERPGHRKGANATLPSMRRYHERRNLGRAAPAPRWSGTADRCARPARAGPAPCARLVRVCDQQRRDARGKLGVNQAFGSLSQRTRRSCASAPTSAMYGSAGGKRSNCRSDDLVVVSHRGTASTARVRCPLGWRC